MYRLFKTILIFFALSLFLLAFAGCRSKKNDPVSSDLPDAPSEPVPSRYPAGTETGKSFIGKWVREAELPFDLPSKAGENASQPVGWMLLQIRLQINKDGTFSADYTEAGNFEGIRKALIQHGKTEAQATELVNSKKAELDARLICEGRWTEEGEEQYLLAGTNGQTRIYRMNTTLLYLSEEGGGYFFENATLGNDMDMNAQLFDAPFSLERKLPCSAVSPALTLDDGENALHFTQEIVFSEKDGSTAEVTLTVTLPSTQRNRLDAALQKLNASERTQAEEQLHRLTGLTPGAVTGIQKGECRYESGMYLIEFESGDIYTAVYCDGRLVVIPQGCLFGELYQWQP